LNYNIELLAEVNKSLEELQTRKIEIEHSIEINQKYLPEELEANKT
jgi:hypothetical protein